ncbi:hypothetical protein QBC34DRAFT_427484 [Podospora aff. communis PSN243]|uniref:MARVEL domain-containing protein n=1 Tax=Podospora aff. communis PSN243 TaxID=3040156 RepID=A0AAV9GIL1_9PEZI|nr:hypothetical protein QBC34DRAFT_427484 [Podospora aff. communis PSN243]
MDNSRTSRLSNIIPRSLLGINNFMILASSAIVTGILSHFLHHYRYRNTYIVYMEVIAVLTLFLYLFAMFTPAFKSYRGYLLPLDLILTYLWLASLIFSSQYWSGGRCVTHAPYGMMSSVPGVVPGTYVTTLDPLCRLKHAAQAFNIIGFTFLLFNTIIEAIMWATHHRREHDTVNGTGYNKAPAGTVTDQCGVHAAV